jgi:hypothetical protein
MTGGGQRSVYRRKEPEQIDIAYRHPFAVHRDADVVDDQRGMRPQRGNAGNAQRDLVSRSKTT